MGGKIIKNHRIVYIIIFYCTKFRFARYAAGNMNYLNTNIVSSNALKNYIEHLSLKTYGTTTDRNMENTEICYIGVDRNKFYKENDGGDMEEDKFIILFMGRFVEQKRPLLFISIVKEFMETISKNRGNDDGVEIWMVGDGLLWNEVEREIDRMDFQVKFKLWGNINDIHQLRTIYSAASILVLPSAYEGIASTVYEVKNFFFH